MTSDKQHKYHIRFIHSFIYVVSNKSSVFKMILLIIGLVFCLSTIFLYLLKLSWNADDKRLGLSGPTLRILFGNTLEILKHTSVRKGLILYFNLFINNNNSILFSIKGFLKFLEYNKQYGGTFRIRLLNKLVIFTSDLEIIEVNKTYYA